MQESKNYLIKQGLLLEKIIYAKRVKFDQKTLVKILELEIESHVKKFPHLECESIQKPVKLQDRSMLYSITFKAKPIIKTYKCAKTTNNPNMGVECWSDDNVIFLFTKFGWANQGDEVKIEVDSKNNYRRIWVNDELKTNDYHHLVHNIK